MSAKKYLTPEIKSFRQILKKLDVIEKSHEWPDSEKDNLQALRDYLLLQIANSREEFIESKAAIKKRAKSDDVKVVKKNNSKIAKGSIMSGLIGKTSSRNWKKVK